MIISPTLDRYAELNSVKTTIKSVANVYNLFGQSNRLVFQTPLEINRMTSDMEEDILNFYSRIVREGKP